MKRIIALACTALMGLTTVAALAQSASGDGQVTKIDKPAARITVKHGGLKALDMPPMAMAFHVDDAKLLDAVAVGDRVRFSAEKRDGNYTVTAIGRAP